MFFITNIHHILINMEKQARVSRPKLGSKCNATDIQYSQLVLSGGMSNHSVQWRIQDYTTGGATKKNSAQSSQFKCNANIANSHIVTTMKMSKTYMVTTLFVYTRLAHASCSEAVPCS